MSGILDLGMNLFISGPELTPISSGLNLYLFGTASNSGMQDGIPLFLEAISGNFVSQPMNLFIKVPNEVSVSGQLNLHINSDNAQLSSSLYLFLANTPIASGLSLYMKGMGYIGDGDLADNYHPYQSGMNLYIERNLANGIPLSIHGLDMNSSGGLDMYLKGVLGSASGLQLSIPNTKDDQDNFINLTIQGF